MSRLLNGIPPLEGVFEKNCGIVTTGCAAHPSLTASGPLTDAHQQTPNPVETPSVGARIVSFPALPMGRILAHM